MVDAERVWILSVPFHNVTFDDTVAWATDRMERGVPGGIVVTPNLDFMLAVSRDRDLRRMVFASDCVVADGMPAVWLSGLLGPRLKARVTGSDLTPALLKVCGERGWSVFAIGGAPGVAETALKRMQGQHPGLKIAGTVSPPMVPFEQMDLAGIAESVRQTSPRLLLVAMGMGKQEKMMHWLRAHSDVPVMMGIGGSLDFLAGVQTRAPKWVQRVGLEWVWRTATDPGRFIKRYSRDGVWLLGTLVRLFGLRIAAAARRPARGDSAGDAFGTGTILRMPFVATKEDQRSFLEEAERRAWTTLDLRSHRWLNSLELAVLAVLDEKREKASVQTSICVSSPVIESLLSMANLFEHKNVAHEMIATGDEAS